MKPIHERSLAVPQFKHTGTGMHRHTFYAEYATAEEATEMVESLKAEGHSAFAQRRHANLVAVYVRDKKTLEKQRKTVITTRLQTYLDMGDRCFVCEGTLTIEQILVELQQRNEDFVWKMNRVCSYHLREAIEAVKTTDTKQLE